ncbi:hypothetical protein [Pseudescherichia vulneris]|uniref:hypothetical protein n=1 Tax=Pseudescherichia vulneris TaxID=566 RepID=UPI0030168A96
MATLARRVAKTGLFILLFCLCAKVIDASAFISVETSSHFSQWVYGYASQDNFDDLWFYVDVLGSLLVAIALYNIIIQSLRFFTK